MKEVVVNGFRTVVTFALLLTPAVSAWGQGQASVEYVNPLCITGLPDTPQTMYLQVGVQNTTPPRPDPAARDIWVVAGLDTVQETLVGPIQLGPLDEFVSDQFAVAWGTSTLRLRPRAFACWFGTLGAANDFRASMNTMVEQIMIQLQGGVTPPNPIPAGCHQFIRTMIQNTLDSLVPAIESSSQNQVSLRDQLMNLEDQDEAVLNQIESIRAGVTMGWGAIVDGAVIKLDLQIFQRVQTGPKTQYEGLDEDGIGQGAIGEVDPGATLWINDDDDNGNQTSDTLDMGSGDFASEDDLAPLWWYFAKPVMQPQWMWPGSWTLTINGPGGPQTGNGLRYWTADVGGPPPPPPAPPPPMIVKGSNSPWPVVLPQPNSTNNANYSYDRVYVEAREVSGVNLAEGFTANFAGGMGYQDEARGTVVGVEALAFEGEVGNLTAASNTSVARFTQNPNGSWGTAPTIPGGEFRLYPCKSNAADSTHHVITVRVTIRPARANVRVWSKPYDVDHPQWNSQDAGSPQSAPDYDGIPGTLTDNRMLGGGATAGLLKTSGAVQADGQGRLDRLTQESGDATMLFDVGLCMQPGNNFRIVSGFTREAVLDGLTIRMADNEANVCFTAGMRNLNRNTSAGLPQPASQLKQGPLLTIWRRIHIERDAMGAPTAANNAGLGATGTAGAGVTLNIVTPIANGTVQGADGVLDDDYGVEGRFQNGTIQTDTPPVPVGTNTETSVTVPGSIPNDLALQGCIIRDDDSVTTIPHPTMVHLNDINDPIHNTLALAYVAPVQYDGGHVATNQSNLTWVMNTTTVGTLTANRQSPTNDNNYWTGYLVGAFQGHRGPLMDADGNIRGDNDSDDEDGLGGETYQGTGMSYGSYIYMEDIQDECNEYSDPAATPPIVWAFLDYQSQVCVHELGHQLSLPHRAAGDGFMGPYSNSRLWLDPRDIDIILGLNRPHP